MTSRPFFLSSLLALAALTAPRVALALDDCPPGTTSKSEAGFDWCEPSVCESDAQCRPDEVCRAIPLCLQVGSVAGAKSDAGSRLVATQRCAPDKSCPATTVCSDKNRCVAKTVAARIGLLDLPRDAGATTAEPSTKKSACGCTVVGAKEEGAGLAGIGVGIAVVLSRRIRRRSDRR